MVIVGALQQSAKERLDGEDLEVLSADLQSPHRLCDAVGLQTKVQDIISGNSSKHRIVIAYIANLRIGKDRKGKIGGPQLPNLVGMWHIQGLQNQRLQHAEDNDIRSNPQRQRKHCGGGKPGERRI